MDSFASFFGINNKKSTSTSTNNSYDQDNQKYRDTVVVSYKDHYYDIHFRDQQGGLRHATVADLKERCKRATGVTLATMKLKVSGANIKDDTATLPNSGIHAGSLVLLMGETANTDQVNKTASGNPEEVGYMMRISQVMQKIEGAKDNIETFDIKVVEAIQNPSVDMKETDDYGIQLSELLMQSLITLDGVDCPSEFQTARQKRREAVKLCQELMDRVDQSRAAFKEVYHSNKQQKL